MRGQFARQPPFRGRFLTRPYRGYGARASYRGYGNRGAYGYNSGYRYGYQSNGGYLNNNFNAYQGYNQGQQQATSSDNNNNKTTNMGNEQIH